MSRASVINPYQQFFDTDNITPLSAGTATFYVSDPNTPASIYSDPDLTTAQTNPYTLDAGGRINGDVRFAGTLNLLLKDSDGNSVRTITLVTCFDENSVFSAWDSTTTYGSGGSNIVTGSDGKYYVSLQANNLNKSPLTETAWWAQALFFTSSGSITYLQAIGDLTPTSQALISGTGSSWEVGATLPTLRHNAISGLETSNGTDADHDINVTAGRCNDSTNAVSMSLGSTFVKQIDATWATGTAAGGLASGASLANNTWYHIFVVVVSGAVDVMFDTSVTCANGVANNSVTSFRRIGSVKTNGSANITAYHQVGDYFYWDVMVQDGTSSTFNTSASTLTATVPTGVVVDYLCYLIVGSSDTSNTTFMLMSSLDQTDSTPSSSIANLNVNAVPSTSTVTFNAYARTPTNTSGQVRYRFSGSITGQWIINAQGWIDRRGK